jgi:Ca2+-binding EF-hand superfamily protein
MLDHNGDGLISKQELVEVISKLGSLGEAEEEFLNSLVGNMEKLNSDTINFPEFSDMINRFLSQKSFFEKALRRTSVF